MENILQWGTAGYDKQYLFWSLWSQFWTSSFERCSFKKQQLVEQWHFRAPGEIKGWFLKKNGPWNIEMNVHFYHFKSKACWIYCLICLETTKLIITTLLRVYKVRTKHSYSVMHTVEDYYVAKGNYLFTCTALKGA